MYSVSSIAHYILITLIDVPAFHLHNVPELGLLWDETGISSVWKTHGKTIYHCLYSVSVFPIFSSVGQHDKTIN